MEAYIVRIDRRDGKDPHRVEGLVEDVERECEQAFSSFDELGEILAPAKKRASRKRQPGSSGDGRRKG